MEIKKPCKAEVEKYLSLCDTQSNYVEQEKASKKLFALYPNNNDISEVLLKVNILNDFYSTNIFNTYKVAEYIVSLNIDKKLKIKDLSVVNDIADKTKNGINRNIYSFATKYCVHHLGNEFPIFDSYVAKILIYLNKQDKFFKFSYEDCRDYKKFYSILNVFREFYQLNNFTLRQIDIYLWQAGKDYFTKKY